MSRFLIGKLTIVGFFSIVKLFFAKRLICKIRYFGSRVIRKRLLMPAVSLQAEIEGKRDTSETKSITIATRNSLVFCFRYLPVS